jgi:hypothetical protein
VVGPSCGAASAAPAGAGPVAAASSAAVDPLAGARVDVPPGGLPDGLVVRIADARETALPLFPDVTVMRAEASAPLSLRASIRVPYTEALLETWDVADEQTLGLYALDADGLWSWTPAAIVAEENVALATVDRLTSWAVLPGGLLSAWQQRQLVGAGFERGTRNVLLIHGWNSSPWDGCMLALAAAMSSRYERVASYAYPSAVDIASNARWLRDALAARYGAGVSFDIIGFSEGGLVARAAIEAGAWNDGRTIASSVGTLVTIATPHLGLAPEAPRSLLGDEASEQMRAGSAFLRALNDGASHEGVRYFAIAGDGAPGRAGDGLVEVASALGGGAVAFDGTATVPLVHAPSRDGAVRGMPCDASVYAVLGDDALTPMGGPPGNSP